MIRSHQGGKDTGDTGGGDSTVEDYDPKGGYDIGSDDKWENTQEVELLVGWFCTIHGLRQRNTMVTIGRWPVAL